MSSFNQNPTKNDTDKDDSLLSKIQCDTTGDPTLIRPLKCAVDSCNNYFDSKSLVQRRYKFHNFPVEDSLRKIWLIQCKLSPKIDTSKLKVCTDHFQLYHYHQVDLWYKLKETAIPIHNLKEITDIDNNTITLEEYKNAINEYNDNCIKLLELEKETTILKLQESSVKKGLKKIDRLQRSYKLLRGRNKVGKVADNNLTKIFSPQQINVLLGKEKVFWSDDDLAMGFSLRQMSSKEFYLYVKNVLNIPLPALSCVQRWAASK